MAMRPSQQNNGFTYSTVKSTSSVSGFEPGNIARIEGTPFILTSVYVATALAVPIPSWILLFDRPAGNTALVLNPDNLPQGGELADLTGPRITVAGEVINFVPPAERINLDAIKRQGKCMDPEADADDLGIIYGYPLDSGLVVALSSTPVIYTPVAGALINLTVRGRNLP